MESGDFKWERTGNEERAEAPDFYASLRNNLSLTESMRAKQKCRLSKFDVIPVRIVTLVLISRYCICVKK